MNFILERSPGNAAQSSECLTDRIASGGIQRRRRDPGAVTPCEFRWTSSADLPLTWFQAVTLPNHTMLLNAPATVRIFVSALSSNTLALDVTMSDTIDKVKSMIHGRERITPDCQRLVFAGKELLDGCILSDFNLQSDSTVFLVLRLAGGMHEPEQAAPASSMINDVESAKFQHMTVRQLHQQALQVGATESELDDALDQPTRQDVRQALIFLITTKPVTQEAQSRAELKQLTLYQLVLKAHGLGIAHDDVNSALNLDDPANGMLQLILGIVGEAAPASSRIVDVESAEFQYMTQRQLDDALDQPARQNIRQARSRAELKQLTLSQLVLKAHSLGIDHEDMNSAAKNQEDGLIQLILSIVGEAKPAEEPMADLVEEDMADGGQISAEQYSELTNELNTAVDDLVLIRQDYEHGSIEDAVAMSRLAQVTNDAKIVEDRINIIRSAEMDRSLESKELDMVLRYVAAFFEEAEEFLQVLEQPDKVLADDATPVSSAAGHSSDAGVSEHKIWCGASDIRDLREPSVITSFAVRCLWLTHEGLSLLAHVDPARKLWRPKDVWKGYASVISLMGRHPPLHNNHSDVWSRSKLQMPHPLANTTAAAVQNIARVFFQALPLAPWSFSEFTFDSSLPSCCIFPSIVGGSSSMSGHMDAHPSLVAVRTVRTPDLSLKSYSVAPLTRRYLPCLPYSSDGYLEVELQILEDDLAEAVDESNFELASSLQKQIRELKEEDLLEGLHGLFPGVDATDTQSVMPMLLAQKPEIRKAILDARCVSKETDASDRVAKRVLVKRNGLLGNQMFRAKSFANLYPKVRPVEKVIAEQELAKKLRPKQALSRTERQVASIEPADSHEPEVTLDTNEVAAVVGECTSDANSASLVSTSRAAATLPRWNVLTRQAPPENNEPALVVAEAVQVPQYLPRLVARQTLTCGASLRGGKVWPEVKYPFVEISIAPTRRAAASFATLRSGSLSHSAISFLRNVSAARLPMPPMPSLSKAPYIWTENAEKGDAISSLYGEVKAGDRVTATQLEQILGDNAYDTYYNRFIKQASEHQKVREELFAMSTDDLLKEVAAQGIVDEVLAKAINSNDPKESVIQLILGAKAGPRSQLVVMKISQLEARARAAGATVDDVDAAVDAGNSKEALVDLVLLHEASPRPLVSGQAVEEKPLSKDGKPLSKDTPKSSLSAKEKVAMLEATLRDKDAEKDAIVRDIVRDKDAEKDAIVRDKDAIVKELREKIQALETSNTESTRAESLEAESGDLTATRTDDADTTEGTIGSRLEPIREMAYTESETTGGDSEAAKKREEATAASQKALSLSTRRVGRQSDESDTTELDQSRLDQEDPKTRIGEHENSMILSREVNEVVSDGSGVSAEFLAAIMDKQVDSDGSGVIDCTELVAATHHHQRYRHLDKKADVSLFFFSDVSSLIFSDYYYSFPILRQQPMRCSDLGLELDVGNIVIPVISVEPASQAIKQRQIMGVSDQASIDSGSDVSESRIYAYVGAVEMPENGAIRNYPVHALLPGKLYGISSGAVQARFAMTTVQQLVAATMLPRILSGGPVDNAILGGHSYGCVLASNTTFHLETCGEGPGGVFMIDLRGAAPWPDKTAFSTRQGTLGSGKFAMQQQLYGAARAFQGVHNDHVPKMRSGTRSLHFVCHLLPSDLGVYVSGDMSQPRMHLRIAQHGLHLLPDTQHNSIATVHTWDIARQIQSALSKDA